MVKDEGTRRRDKFLHGCLSSTVGSSCCRDIRAAGFARVAKIRSFQYAVDAARISLLNGVPADPSVLAGGCLISVIGSDCAVEFHERPCARRGVDDGRARATISGGEGTADFPVKATGKQESHRQPCTSHTGKLLSRRPQSTRRKNCVRYPDGSRHTNDPADEGSAVRRHWLCSRFSQIGPSTGESRHYTCARFPTDKPLSLRRHHDKSEGLLTVRTVSQGTIVQEIGARAGS